MDEDIVFDKINYLLEGSGFEYDIRGMEDLERFVNNPGNRRLGVYDEIRHLYKGLSKDSEDENIRPAF